MLIDAMKLKLESLKSGNVIVTNDEELDLMMSLDSELFDYVRSAPNPERVGIKDQYIAWLPNDEEDIAYIQAIRAGERLGPYRRVKGE